MKLNLATPIATEELSAIMSSVGQNDLLRGVIYQPFMQLLVSPSQDLGNAVVVWELTQKFYANKDGEVELSPVEIMILREKLNTVVYPWLKARLLSVLE